MPERIDKLEKEVFELKALLLPMLTSGKLNLSRDIQLQNGRDIIVGTGTGTMIATENTQKLGFFGITPKVQQAYISHPSADVNSLQTAVDTLLSELENYGIIDPTP